MSSSSDSSDSVNLDLNLEFTLDDVYETLKDVKKEREQEMEQLLSAELNNMHFTLDETVTHAEILKKQQQFVQSLTNQIKQEKPSDYSVPQTSDFNIQVVKELENEVRVTQELFLKRKEELKEIEDNIAYLEKRKAELQDKEGIYLGETENVTTKTYTSEVGIARQLLKQVKEDLRTVVAKLFPSDNHEIFETLLADLTSAYTKGGDDVYVEVNSMGLEYVNFLLEADLVTYHRNDKSRIKLVDLL